MKIEMTDGRTLIGVFLCTDRDKNVILGSCEEYLKPPDSGDKEDPRILGLAMIPGHHIVSIHVDEDKSSNSILWYLIYIMCMWFVVNVIKCHDRPLVSKWNFEGKVNIKVKVNHDSLQ